jgi:prepilin-type N-terminal cleavage/methylation domain-containing protein
VTLPSVYFHEFVMRNGEYFLMPRDTALTIARSGRHHSPLTTRRGFTLVEVAVVMLVIGILAAIAIPRYSGSKDKAYLAAMKADLVSASIYEEQYAAENHGQYFSGVATSDTPVQGYRASKEITVTLVAANILGSQLSEWTATAKHAQSPESCAMRGGIITCTTEDDLTTGILLLN